MDIPQDWSMVSDNTALKYIAYLRKNSWKHKITMDTQGVIHIGTIAQVEKTFKQGTACMVINNKDFRHQMVADCRSPYTEARDLYAKLEYRLLPLTTKVTTWLRKLHTELYR